MPVFAVVNQNEGVGKSTTAVNLAASFGPYGARTLLVDCDPRGDASTSAGQGITTTGLYGALINGDVGGAIAPSSAERVDLMMATPRLEHIEYHLGRRTDEIDQRLKSLLTSVRDRYSFVFLDCPSALDLLTTSALIAADVAIVPFRAGPDPLNGLDQLRDTLERVRRESNPTLRVFGIVLTMYDGRREDSRTGADAVMERYGHLAFRTRIPYDPCVREALAAGCPVVQHDPTSPSARAYTALAGELADRLSTSWV